MSVSPLLEPPDTITIATKLQRIRSVIGNTNYDKKATINNLIELLLPQLETSEIADIDQGVKHEIERISALVEATASRQTKIEVSAQKIS
jgi:lipopolysaccharide biosynthesis protein